MPEDHKITVATRNLTEALQELTEAQIAFDKARQSCDAARRHETTSLNMLNNMQRRVDSLMASVKTASAGGDWNDRSRPDAVTVEYIRNAEDDDKQRWRDLLREV